MSADEPRVDEAVLEGPTERPSGSVANRVGRGSLILVIQQGLSQGLRLVGNVILTRLLTPEAFGLMAIVRMFMLGLQLVSDVGLQPAIIRLKDGASREVLDTGFTIQAIRGVILLVVGAAIAGPVAIFYEEPLLQWLLIFVMATSLIRGFESLNMVTLSRRLQVGRIAAIDLSSQVLALVAMVVVAYVFRSVWALVVGAIATALVRTVLSHVAVSGPRSRFGWDRETASYLSSFGRWILLSTLMTFIAGRIDVALLGKLVPMEQLGIYSVAFLIARVPDTIVQRLSNMILLPVLAEAQDAGREAFAARVGASRKLFRRASMAIVLALVGAAPLFFFVLYDDRYHAAGWIAQLAMAAQWFSYLGLTLMPVLSTLGDSRALAIANAGRLVVTPVACFVGFQLGDLAGLMIGTALGAAIGYSALARSARRHGFPTVVADLRYTVSVFGLALVISVGGKLLGESLGGVLGSLGPVLMPAIIASAILVPFGLSVFKEVRAQRRSRAST